VRLRLDPPPAGARLAGLHSWQRPPSRGVQERRGPPSSGRAVPPPSSSPARPLPSPMNNERSPSPSFPVSSLKERPPILRVVSGMLIPRSGLRTGCRRGSSANADCSGAASPAPCGLLSSTPREAARRRTAAVSNWHIFAFRLLLGLAVALRSGSSRDGSEISGFGFVRFHSAQRCLDGPSGTRLSPRVRPS